MIANQDQQYINALISNDTAVLNELYSKFSPKIKQMVLKNNGTESDAADIFQEALIAIYKKAKEGNFVLTCPLEAYLYLICKTRWINELNKKANKSVTLVDDDGYIFKDDTFAEAAIHQNKLERNNLLQNKFKELGDGCKELLQLSWSGLGMEEVAQKLNNSYGYVRKKKSECMAKLISMVKSSPQFATLQW